MKKKCSLFNERDTWPTDDRVGEMYATFSVNGMALGWHECINLLPVCIYTLSVSHFSSVPQECISTLYAIKYHQAFSNLDNSKLYTWTELVSSVTLYSHFKFFLMRNSKSLCAFYLFTVCICFFFGRMFVGLFFQVAFILQTTTIHNFFLFWFFNSLKSVWKTEHL